MTALYVTEPGAVVRRSGDTLEVTVDRDPDGAGPAPQTRRTLATIQVHHLTWLALSGGAHLTRDAAALLRLLQSNRPREPALGAAYAEVSQIAGRAEEAGDAQTLRGHEGAGTRAYFSGYSAGFSGRISFTGRARPIPPTP